MIQPKLTLGALYRCLLDRLDTRLGVRVEIHFEERTSVVVEHAAAGTEAERIDQRTFDAELAVRDERVAEATLTAGATGADTLVIRIAESDGESRYSIAGEGFGVLRERPDLFDPAEFGVRLDRVAVDDAMIDQETPGGSGRIVIDAEIESEAFARLLRAFGGGQPENPELPLLSHSAVLSAASDVTLDYWWSLLGLDEVEGRPRVTTWSFATCMPPSLRSRRRTPTLPRSKPTPGCPSSTISMRSGSVPGGAGLDPSLPAPMPRRLMRIAG